MKVYAKAGLKLLSGLVILAAVVTGCGFNTSSNVHRDERQSIEENQTNLLAQYPVPRFDTSLERDILVQLYALRNKARNTHSVITSDGTGTPMYDCPSIGYPIANDVRITSSEAAYNFSGNPYTLPQAEPNGVYPAASSWGTWVFCVNDDGSLNPIYNEMDTLTFPFPVTVDYATGRITKVGDPTMTITLTDPES